MRPARSRMRITAYEVTDLPEPDSPTMPTVSPLAIVRSTCCTAVTMPRRVVNSTVRSRTSRSGIAVIAAPSSPPLRVDDVAQAIAEQVEAEHGDHQCEAREESDPPFAGHHECRAFGDHDAPFGCRRPDAKTNERKACGIENGIAHGQRHLHDHDRHDVRQHM